MTKATITTRHHRGSRPANGPASTLAAVLFGVALLAPSLAHAAGVTIEKPWMRFIIPARPAAGYFTLKNDTDSAVELTGASSTACGTVMLHQSKQVNGVDKMMMVKSLKVPAHGTLTFAPGGYHLMCMKPKAGMKRGASVPVALKFAGGTTLTASFPVKGPGGR